MRRKTLKLRPHLKWTGKLHVTGKEGDEYIVEFDAFSLASKTYIYDVTTMTREMLEVWVDLADVALGG